MIGFNHLGRLGQLGNQMFQYASLRGIASNRSYSCIWPNYTDPIDDGIGNWIKTELTNPFLPSQPVGQINTQRYIQEPHYHFSQDLFDNCPDNVSLFGFFQSEKYFKDIDQEIRKDFKFREEIENPCLEMMNNIDSSPIALHIRRGDFLINSANHFNQSLQYYEESLKKFDSNRQVIIFSDDTAWCKKQNLFEDDRFLVSEEQDQYHDMCLMSLCSDFIIANSSFSWWGAWLANKGKVIAPSKWFGPNNANNNTKDLYCDHWEVI